MYLVDTNVISAASPLRREDGDVGALRAWLTAASERLFLSAVSVAEIEAGIARARRMGAVKKASALAAWLDLTLHLYAGRVLPFDTAVARIAGRLLDQAAGRGGDPGFEDAAIAATAVHAGFVVLTRNVRHFRLMEVSFIDPFSSLPAV